MRKEKEVNEEWKDIKAILGETSVAEIRKAIRALKNGKAAGVDDIKAEMIKCCENIAVVAFLKLFKIIWERELIPK